MSTQNRKGVFARVVQAFSQESIEIQHNVRNQCIIPALQWQTVSRNSEPHKVLQDSCCFSSNDKKAALDFLNNI